jgi:hypothetical protein
MARLSLAAEPALAAASPDCGMRTFSVCFEESKSDLTLALWDHAETQHLRPRTKLS